VNDATTSRRRCCFSVGNYALFYRQVDDGVEIVRMVSGARNFEALFGPEP